METHFFRTETNAPTYLCQPPLDLGCVFHVSRRVTQTTPIMRGWLCAPCLFLCCGTTTVNGEVLDGDGTAFNGDKPSVWYAADAPGLSVAIG